MLYVQRQLMKNNLILIGINEVPLGRTEDCMKRLSHFVRIPWKSKTSKLKTHTGQEREEWEKRDQ